MCELHLHKLTEEVNLIQPQMLLVYYITAIKFIPAKKSHSRDLFIKLKKFFMKGFNNFFEDVKYIFVMLFFMFNLFFFSFFIQDFGFKYLYFLFWSTCWRSSRLVSYFPSIESFPPYCNKKFQTETSLKKFHFKKKKLRSYNLACMYVFINC